MTSKSAEFARFLVENGYTDLHFPGDGRWVGLFDFMFTRAIIVGTVGDLDGYDDRWCYHKGPAASLALDEWESRDFVGEPTGWHRHPLTGRRRDEYGEEYVNP